MLQSTLTRLGAASCSDCLDFTLRDLGTLASMIIVVLSVLYKVLYEPTLLMRKGGSPYVQSLSSVWLISYPFNKCFSLIRDSSGAVLSFISQLSPSQPKPIVLSGQEGRRIFFKEKNLHLYETFQGLLGSVSTLEAIFHPIY
jgi:sterol 14-demethylase